MKDCFARAPVSSKSCCQRNLSSYPDPFVPFTGLAIRCYKGNVTGRFFSAPLTDLSLPNSEFCPSSSNSIFSFSLWINICYDRIPSIDRSLSYKQLRASNPVEENLFDELSGSRRLLNSTRFRCFIPCRDIIPIGRSGNIRTRATFYLSKMCQLDTGYWPCRLLATTF